MIRRFLLIFLSVGFLTSLSAIAQEDVPLAPMLNSIGGENNSLMDMMKGNFLRQYQDAMAKDKSKDPSRRHARPRPELGKGQYSEEPIDISKYIGTEGDPDKTIDKLRDLGKIPPPQGASQPLNASGTTDKLWDNVTPEKRFDYAKDLFNRRKYDEAQLELERFLSEKPNENDRFSALMMREKCLFHRRFNDVVQDDYYRLKSFFPKRDKEIEELKSYIEEKSGISPLKKKVLENPPDPTAQYTLLSLYEKYDWLDFAEDFFLSDIKDTSATTAKSLCEVYYKKQDYDMLATLSQAAQELHPHETAFLYNEGVARYQMGDPASREKALELFRRVALESPAPHLRKNAQWYIDRLTATNKR